MSATTSSTAWTPTERFSQAFRIEPRSFCAIEGLAPAVALDHARQHVLDVLVGRVAAVALEALAAPADELPVTADARVDDPVLGVAAERALHASRSG